MGFGWPGVEVYFPLNKRTCLRLKKGIQPPGIAIPEGHLDEINNLVMELWRRQDSIYTLAKNIGDTHGCSMNAAARCAPEGTLS